MKVIAKGINYYLTSDLDDEDFPTLMKHFGNKDMSKYNVFIPYPFTDKHAQNWINESKKHIGMYGQFATAAIRDEKDKLIGEIGYDFEHRNVAELSYWIAKPYWGGGIATAAVAKMCQIGFKKFKLRKIIAFVQASNTGSIKVLERNKFVQECRLSELVHGVFDAKMFGLTRAQYDG